MPRVDRPELMRYYAVRALVEKQVAEAEARLKTLREAQSELKLWEAALFARMERTAHSGSGKGC